MDSDRAHDVRCLIARIALVAIVGLAMAACSSAPKLERVEREEYVAAAESLTFRGNRNVDASTLRSAVRDDIERLAEYRRPEARTGDRDPAKSVVDDIAYEVELYYRTIGHHFVEVSYEYDPETRVGEIQIDEGPRVLIDSVGFRGNEAISDSALRDLLADKRTWILGLGDRIFVERDVRSLTGAIRDAYEARGFREVRVESPEIRFTEDRGEATIRVEIVEGPQYRMGGVTVDESAGELRDAILERLAPLTSRPWVPARRLQIRGIVEEIFGDRGYPDARAGVAARYEPAEDEVAVGVEITVDPGPRVRIGAINIIGNDRTRAGLIKSRLRMDTGDWWRAKDIRSAFHRLFSTQLFRAIRIGPAAVEDTDQEEETAEPSAESESLPELEDPATIAEPSEDESLTRDLLVEVEEAPTRDYFGEVGWGSYDLLRVKGGVTERNLFGRGLQGRLEALGSIRGWKATAGVTDPWFLRSRWIADASVTALSRQEPSFTVQEIEGRTQVHRPLSRSIDGGLAYRLSLSRLKENEVDEEEEEEGGENLRVGAFGPFLEYDTRNDIFAPTRGIRIRGAVELAHPSFGGEITFIHPTLQARAFLPLGPGTVLGANLETQWKIPLSGTETIPLQERLFNGGENSVRSFKESELGPLDDENDPRGGEVRNLFSIELRQHLFDTISGAVFFDYGNVGLTTDDWSKDFRPAVGIGLRYGLPIGPIRLDLGHNYDRRREEDGYVLQLAVGMPF